MKSTTIGGTHSHGPARPILGRAGLAAAVAAVAATSAADAALLTRWQFNDRSMNATVGVGSAQLVRTTHSGYVAGAAADGSTTSNLALRAGRFGSVPGASFGAQFTTGVSGYEGIRVTYWQLNDRSSSRWARVQYSLDGGAFTSAGLAGGGLYRISQAGVFKRVTFAIPGTGALDGVDQLRFRVVAAAAPGSSQFAGTVGAYRPTGCWRFDLVSVTGTAIGEANASTPAPGAIALLGLGGAWAGSRRRRA